MRCSPRTRGFELRTTLSRGQHFAIGSADVLPAYDCIRVGMVLGGACMRFHRSHLVLDSGLCVPVCLGQVHTSESKISQLDTDFPRHHEARNDKDHTGTKHEEPGEKLNGEIVSATALVQQVACDGTGAQGGKGHDCERDAYSAFVVGQLHCPAHPQPHSPTQVPTSAGEGARGAMHGVKRDCKLPEKKP